MTKRFAVVSGIIVAILFFLIGKAISVAILYSISENGGIISIFELFLLSFIFPRAIALVAGYMIFKTHNRRK